MDEQHPADAMPDVNYVARLRLLTEFLPSPRFVQTTRLRHRSADGPAGRWPLGAQAASALGMASSRIQSRNRRSAGISSSPAHSPLAKTQVRR